MEKNSKHRSFVESLKIDIDEIDSTEELEMKLISKYEELFGSHPDEEDDD